MARDIDSYTSVDEIKTYVDSLERSTNTPIFSNFDKSYYESVEFSDSFVLTYVTPQGKQPSIGHEQFLNYLRNKNKVTADIILYNSNTFNFKTNLEKIIDDKVADEFADQDQTTRDTLKKEFKSQGIKSLFANKSLRAETYFGINLDLPILDNVYHALAMYQIETDPDQKKILKNVLFESLILTVNDNAEEAGYDPKGADWYKDEATILAEAAAAGKLDTVTRLANVAAQNQIVGNGELTESEYLNYVQCALFADVFAGDAGFSLGSYPQTVLKGEDANGNEINGHHYSKRVFPITILGSDGQEPNEFMNRLLYPYTVNGYFANYNNDFSQNGTADILGRKKLHKFLSFIVPKEGKNGSIEGLEEYPVHSIQGFRTLTEDVSVDIQAYFDDPSPKYNKTSIDYARRQLILIKNRQLKTADFQKKFGKTPAEIKTKVNAILLERDRGIIRQGRLSGDEPELSKLTIKYNGTNPSMARKDVEVNMQITMTGLDQLDSKVIADPDYKLESLIEFPYIGRRKGALPIRNHYDPLRNRLRLKIQTPDAGGNADLIIDLTTIDHSISRDSATGFVTLDINYRGFFNSVFSMPLMDCLASDKAFDDRVSRSVKISKKLKTYYDDPTAANLTDVRDELKNDRKDLEDETSKVKALNLIDNLLLKNRVFRYTINETTVASFEASGFFDYSYVKDLMDANPQAKLITITQAKATNRQLQQTYRNEIKDIHNLAISDDDEPPEVQFQSSGYCIYLGDIIDEFLTPLYREPTAGLTTFNNRLKNNIGTEDLFTLLTSIEMFNPVYPTQRAKFNLAQIPVDIGFFSRWFDQTVTRKKIAFLPFQQAVGSLIERLINNTLFEVCLGNSMINEKPPILRTGFFHDCRLWSGEDPNGANKNDLNKLEAILMNDDKFVKEIDDKWIKDNSIILKRDASFKVTMGNKSKEIPLNYGTLYFVAYMQRPSFNFHKVGDSGKSSSFTDTTPRIHYGRLFENANYLSNVTFTKTTQPFLRESRFFNNSGLTLLSNFYDLDFSFNSIGANTLLYPGTAIDFYLRDWSSKSQWDPHFGGSVNNNRNTIVLPSAANKLGFGGYYIISSVDYNLGTLAEDFEIKISSKFIGTETNDALISIDEVDEYVIGAGPSSALTNTAENGEEEETVSISKSIRERVRDGELTIFDGGVFKTVTLTTLSSLEVGTALFDKDENLAGNVSQEDKQE